MNAPPICYRIDASDTIVFTDTAWFDFAARNNFTKPFVLGTPLWRHITDETTANLYHDLVHRVRATRKAVQVPFRCDAPAETRDMRLEITPDSDGAVHFRSVTCEGETRAPIHLIDITQPRTKEFLKMCSWCKRVMVVAEWVEIETAVEALRLFTGDVLPQLTHSICPECERRFHEMNPSEQLGD